MFIRILVVAIAVFLQTSVGLAGVQKTPLDDMDYLINASDLIIQGHVRSVKQGMRDTTIYFGIQEVFKGENTSSTIRVKHRGGKHQVVRDEPEFVSYDQAILYLVRDGDSYKCLDGAQGKKTIRNKNIYLQPDNNFAVMKLEKYVETLTERLDPEAENS